MIVKVHRWKALAEFLQSKQNLETMENMEGTLAQLMAGLGAQVDLSSKKPAKSELGAVSAYAVTNARYRTL